jgi:hypothetical protein
MVPFSQIIYCCCQKVLIKCIHLYSLGHTVCKTVHRINDRIGESIQVDKMCAMPDQCSNDHVGCKATGLEGEIVSLNSNIT